MTYLPEGAAFLEALGRGALGAPWTLEEARDLLRQGNARYMAVHRPPPRDMRPLAADAAPRDAEAAPRPPIQGEYAKQRPFAVVLCCADSRASPEIVYAQEQGMLFVVRTAGNTADDKAVANIAYALHALKVPLVVVLGHQECGAVGAAIEDAAGNPVDCRYAAFVTPILRAVSAGGGRDDRARWADTVRENIRQTAAELARHPNLRVDGQPPAIDMAYYRFDDGKAEVFT